MKSMKILKAISNNTKLRLISLLLDAELCVCELEEILEIRQANISKNLISLKEAGIVDVRRNAQRGFYFLTNDFLSNTNLVAYIKDVKKKEDMLVNDYSVFIEHESNKDTKVYVCNAFKKESKL
ncbi:ArsR/SmtB family transcription factor [Candidatus Izimaplasma bacterium ZiA1]|uniref:ArsR/SmtB family transcription factor n=1 Tax=Candidatus Izimoplasma sp. ZiA1 TaxID=2024899 RepID=UPI00143B509C